MPLLNVVMLEVERAVEGVCEDICQLFGTGLRYTVFLCCQSSGCEFSMHEVDCYNNNNSELPHQKTWLPLQDHKQQWRSVFGHNHIIHASFLVDINEKPLVLPEGNDANWGCPDCCYKAMFVLKQTCRGTSFQSSRDCTVSIP